MASVFYREKPIGNNAHKEGEKYQTLFTISAENGMFADFFHALNELMNTIQLNNIFTYICTHIYYYNFYVCHETRQFR